MQGIVSPITGKDNPFKIGSISTKGVNEFYKDLNVDVASFIKEKNEIALYQCPTSYLKFYESEGSMGNDSFYDQLSKIPWYYVENKYEYQQVLTFLKKDRKGVRILEIGCGTGEFIKQATKAGFLCTGLELNSNAVEKMKANGMDVYNLLIEEFANVTKFKFDYIISFQVFEHIPNLKSIYEAIEKLLNVDGALITAVPNNDSILMKNVFNPLNMPPHHCNLWDRKSLKSVGKIFGYSRISFLYEKVQPIHYNWFNTIIIDKSKRFPLLYKILLRIFNSRYSTVLTKFLVNIFRGHTIISIYRR